MNKHKRTVSKIGHYTIVEMMMVIAIFMIILSMAMAAWLNSGDHAKLRNAASKINGILNSARAQAVAEREPIKVVFDKHQDVVRIRLYYTDNKLLPNTEPLLLPADVRFVTVPSDSNPPPATPPPERLAKAGDSAVLELPDAIVFDKFGGCPQGPDKQLRLLSVPTVGDKVEAGQTYYDIYVNLFTGRIKTLQREVE